MQTAGAVGRAVRSAFAVIGRLGSNVATYCVENPPRWGLAAETRTDELLSGGDVLAISGPFLADDNRLCDFPGLPAEVLV